jgi:ribosomal silencing factor RsfS
VENAEDEGENEGEGEREREGEEKEQWLAVETAKVGVELLSTVHISREQWRM